MNAPEQAPADEASSTSKQAAPTKSAVTKQAPRTKKAAPTKTATPTKKTPTKKTPTKKTPTKKAAPAPSDDTATIEVTADVAAPLEASTPEEAAPSRIARARALAEVLKARGLDEYEHLQARRETSRTIDSVFVASEHDAKVGGGILAAAVAFRLFLFMVPFVFVVVVAFGIGTDASGESTQHAARSAGAVGLLAKSFGSVTGGSLGEHLVAFFVGAFALWLTTRSALRVLRVVSGLTWGVPVPKLPRPTRAALLFVVVTLGAAALMQLVGILRASSLTGGLVATALLVVVPAGLWILFSLRAFPHPDDVGWKAMLPGALLVAVGMQLLHLFTILWIARQVDSKSETYGAIGIALALLFWAYLLGRIFTAGMVLNASLWYRDRPRPGSDLPEDPDE